jgi:hypothetical protein
LIQAQTVHAPDHISHRSSVVPPSPPAPQTTSPPAPIPLAQQKQSHQSQPQPQLGPPLYGSRQFAANPHIIGHEPQTATEGAPFCVYLKSAVDLTTDTRSFRLSFESRRCDTRIVKTKGRQGEYRLFTDVPDFKLTGSTTFQVRVYLVILDESRQEIGTELVGMFLYAGASAHQSSEQPRRNPLKRKSVGDAEELRRSPAKRTATQQPLRPKSEDYGTYAYPPVSGSNYAFYSLHSEKCDNMYSGYNTVEAPQPTTSAYHSEASPRNFPYAFHSSPESSQLPAPTHQLPPPVWQSQFSPLPTDSSVMSAITAAAAAVSASSENEPVVSQPSEVLTPTLIRTSTLQTIDKGEGSSAISNSTAGAGFNPYSIYPNKAVLEIQGDLNGMAKNWTAEEWDNKRRLVQFWRQQNGSTIHTTFRSVPQSDRPTSAICVSCIWWAERNDCFVTSVDCISLLESLVAVRFTVEEKNRIRRNLEGFRPLTVSKGKKDSENFFKLIMQFPSPKPRNIEKDVKVFHWSILPLALKKIIGKYVSNFKIPIFSLPVMILTPSISLPATLQRPRLSRPIHQHHPIQGHHLTNQCSRRLRKTRRHCQQGPCPHQRSLNTLWHLLQRQHLETWLRHLI